MRGNPVENKNRQMAAKILDDYPIDEQPKKDKTSSTKTRFVQIELFFVLLFGAALCILLFIVIE